MTLKKLKLKKNRRGGGIKVKHEKKRKKIPILWRHMWHDSRHIDYPWYWPKTSCQVISNKTIRCCAWSLFTCNVVNSDDHQVPSLNHVESNVTKYMWEKKIYRFSLIRILEYSCGDRRLEVKKYSNEIDIIWELCADSFHKFRR